MVQQVIDTTTLQPNGKQGEPIRTAFNKANANFDELYDVFDGLGTAAQGDLQKLSTDYFGPEPAVTWPGMTWGDQANGLEKRRNAANNAWVTIGPLFDFMYGRSNTLGTLGMAAGVPTGALMQVLENSNGIAFRYANGMQICISPPMGSRVVQTATGPLFMSVDAVIWGYPSEFVSNPNVVGQSESTGRWLCVGAPSPTAVAFRIYSPAASAEAITQRLIAIGKWANV